MKEKKKEFPYIHDLTFFMKRLNLPENFENICKDLTSAYAETRYPSDIIPSEKFPRRMLTKFLKKPKRF